MVLILNFLLFYLSSANPPAPIERPSFKQEIQCIQSLHQNTTAANNWYIYPKINENTFVVHMGSNVIRQKSAGLFSIFNKKSDSGYDNHFMVFEGESAKYCRINSGEKLAFQMPTKSGNYDMNFDFRVGSNVSVSNIRKTAQFNPCTDRCKNDQRVSCSPARSFNNKLIQSLLRKSLMRLSPSELKEDLSKTFSACYFDKWKREIDRFASDPQNLKEDYEGPSPVSQ